MPHGPSGGGMVVPVTDDEIRLDEGEVRQVPRWRHRSRTAENGTTWVARRSFNRGRKDGRSRTLHRFGDVHLPGLPVLLHRLKIVSALLFISHLVAGLFTVNP